MERYSEPAEVRARSWLIEQRLPHHDPDTVALVAARLEARRKGRWSDLLLFVGFAVPYVIWLLWADAGQGSAIGLTMVPIVVGMSISLIRRSVLWRRRDRSTAAQLRGRVTALDRPTWAELLGRSTLVLLVGLVTAALVCAALIALPPDGPGRVGRVAMVLLGSLYCFALLTLARRRSTVACEGVTLAADRRLRIQEAVEAVQSGAVFIALVPPLGGGNTSVTTLLLCGYLLVAGAASWHGRQAWADVLIARLGGAR